MKLNGVDDKRTLRIELESTGFVVTEREAWNDYGRRKWDRSQVFITREEMLKLIKFAQEADSK